MTPVARPVSTYASAIREAFVYLLDKYPEVFVIGQGLWSPWYVGESMADLDKRFGTDRVIDGPVSELATTGAAVGASLFGFRPIVVHPRMDFMLYAMDPIVNHAAKWSHMFGGQAHPAVTVRGIINRGGQQGAQHSQALHAWFAHIPGLRVVMPSTVRDARDLLISSVLSDDPVLYIDDRWLYSRTDDLPPIVEQDLTGEGPRIIREGGDVTFAAAGFSTYLCEDAADLLAARGISCEIVDIRVLNPLDGKVVVESVKKTGRLCAVDGGWRTCGLAGELISLVAENVDLPTWRARPARITLPNAPAPTSKSLEADYFTTVEEIVSVAKRLVKA